MSDYQPRPDTFLQLHTDAFLNAYEGYNGEWDPPDHFMNPSSYGDPPSTTTTMMMMVEGDPMLVSFPHRFFRLLP